MKLRSLLLQLQQAVSGMANGAIPIPRSSKVTLHGPDQSSSSRLVHPEHAGACTMAGLTQQYLAIIILAAS
jgi:hypothetical protein